MLECELLFGERRGQEIQALMESARGESCPCKVGRVCPLAEVIEPEPRLYLIKSAACA